MVGGNIKPVAIDSFWHKRINEAIAFLALAIFGLYAWITFIDPNPAPYSIQLPTILVTIACAASSIVSRVFTESRGAFVRSLLSYLLLIAAIALLLKDTGGIASPYIFIWTLAVAFAGLFGIWSSAPVFLIACGYLALLLINQTVTEHEIIPTVLIIGVPIIFSIIVWSHVHELSSLKRDYSRNPVAYKQRSSEITNLVEESETLISAIGDGVLAVDSQGIIQLINPAAQTLMGWSKRDALTLHYQSVLKLADEQDKELTDATDPIKQALNTNQEARSKVLRLETKNGKKLYVSLVVSPLGDAGSGVIAIVRDITKEHSEEQQQAEFISTASHEMRTPVASIEGYLGLALNPNTATVDEKARDFITKAHESAQHLGRLFQDLLDVSKAEDGRLANTPVALDIVEFTGDVVEGLQQKATDKGLSLVFKPAPRTGEKGDRHLSPVYYVNLDKDHIREVVNNLTENAIKYTPSGEVSVDITGDDEHVVISITDSGIGIPAEDLPHLFQKFYRVDNSDTREIGGTGLGLYLCRRLAETMGGRIWAESTYKKGSTFYVELPRIAAADAQRLIAQQEADKVAARENEVPRTAPAPAPAPAPAASVPPPQAVQPLQPPISAPVAPVVLAPQPSVVSAPAAPQTPIAVAPQPAPSQLQAPVPTPAPAPRRINIPLTSIEQNPTDYTQQRPASVAIPSRNQDNTPK